MPRSAAPWPALLRFAAAFLLLPLGLAGSLELAARLPRFQLDQPVQLAFVTGAGVYLVIHLLLWKPIFMHVMGHELTHAFWAVLLGGKIKSFQVSQAGGQVTLSKSNFMVALAPYFFPFYTFLLLPIYLICLPKFQPVLSFLLGFTLAFHYALTLHSLREHQSDLHELGVFFSLVFVYLMNVVVLVLFLWVLSPALAGPGEFSVATWQRLADWLGWLAGWLRPAPGGGAGA
jgi:hypothetical protein